MCINIINVFVGLFWCAIEFVCDFAFAVDIRERLNELSTKLQGKGVLNPNFYVEVKTSHSRVKFIVSTLRVKLCICSSVQNTS